MDNENTPIPSTMEERLEWIKYQIRLKNTSLSEIAKQNNASRQIYSATLRKPNKKREQHIADAIGFHPSEIWPERY